MDRPRCARECADRFANRSRDGASFLSFKSSGRTVRHPRVADAWGTRSTGGGNAGRGRIRFIVEHMEKLYPGVSSYLESSTTKSWDGHPWARGACSGAKPDVSHPGYPGLLVPKGAFTLLGSTRRCGQTRWKVRWSLAFAQQRRSTRGISRGHFPAKESGAPGRVGRRLIGSEECRGVSREQTVELEQGAMPASRDTSGGLRWAGSHPANRSSRRGSSRRRCRSPRGSADGSSSSPGVQGGIIGRATALYTPSLKATRVHTVGAFLGWRELEAMQERLWRGHPLRTRSSEDGAC